MKADIKQQWLEALRSGNYKQGQTYLRDLEDRYCCLGVLLEVAGQPWVEDGHAYACGADYVGEPNRTGLNQDQQKSLSIDEDTMGHLISMNDGKRAPFVEIADWIEANIPAE